MSQTPSNPNTIGSANIAFTGDTSGIKAAAAEAVRVTKDAAATAGREAGEATKGFDQQIGGAFRRIRGGASAVAAAITLVETALKGLASARSEVEKLADDFAAINRAGDGLRSLAESGDDIAKAYRAGKEQLDELAKALTKAKEDELFSITGLFDRFARELLGADNPFDAQLEAIKQKQKDLLITSEKLREIREQEALIAERERSASEARKALFDDLAKLQAELAAEKREAMSDEEKINAELQKRIYLLGDIRDRATEIGRLDPALDRELKRLEDGFRGAAKRGIERGAKEAMQEVKEIIGREITSIQQQAAQLFNPQQITVQLNELARIMETVANNTRNIGG